MKLVPFPQQVPQPERKYQIDPITGQFDLPDLQEIINQLYQRQGSLLSFLNDFAGEGIENERKRQQLLFEIRFAMKGEEVIEKQWNTLLQLQQESHVLLAEAKLLNVLSMSNTAEEKPEKLLAVLERLNPERWAKRSVQTTKKQKTNPYEETLDA
jgi:hypothetical protein